MKDRIPRNKMTNPPARPLATASTAVPASVLVRIEFEHPTARGVCIAGSFNDWQPGTTEMISLADGRWVKELTLPAGTYEYLLVVDGQWVPDPKAQATVPNPFGGCNSVLVGLAGLNDG